MYANPWIRCIYHNHIQPPPQKWTFSPSLGPPSSSTPPLLLTLNTQLHHISPIYHASHPCHAWPSYPNHNQQQTIRPSQTSLRTILLLYIFSNTTQLKAEVTYQIHDVPDDVVLIGDSVSAEHVPSSASNVQRLAAVVALQDGNLKSKIITNIKDFK